MNILNFMVLRNGKVQDTKFKSFEKKHLEFLSKHFEENGKEKLFPNDSSSLGSLEMPKRILSFESKFNKFLQTYIIFLITHLFSLSAKKKKKEKCKKMELKIFFIMF